MTFIALIIACAASMAAEDGSVHCLGNGRLCVYGQGPDIIQVFGPPYSAPAIGAVTVVADDAACVSLRRPGAAIWRHELNRNGETIAVFTDFVCAELPCFIRMIHASAPIALRYTPEPGLRTAVHATPAMSEAGASQGMLVETPIGRPLVPFGRYPLPFELFNHFAWTGAIEAKVNGQALTLHIQPGEATLYIAGGPGMDDCLKTMETALSAEPMHWLTEAEHWWADFTARGADFERLLPPETPERERLLRVLDDVAVMIKAQQALEGGVLAGYPYHLGYVRDQYGVHRGLVALGHLEMSRDILRFYYDIFQQGGQIRNAQAFGIPGVYHVHENDDVEITGYITLQAFDYLERTGDETFLQEIFPMLSWAWQVQLPHLVQNMLPFNGDETYVAGGILPRYALNDGSAEATLLLYESGRKLAAFAEANHLWTEQACAEARQVLDRVGQSFQDNFWRDGRLITNNPERANTAPLPTSRHGVCERCIEVHWTRRTEKRRYVCVGCLNQDPLPPAPREMLALQSVSLTPLYFHAALMDQALLRPQVDEIAAEYQRSGQLPSRPDGEVAVGYDYGLLLYALTELGHPAAQDLFRKTLSLADSTGAWAEYYRNHQPFNTRCRPWESAINIEALLHWISKTNRIP